MHIFFFLVRSIDIIAGVASILLVRFVFLSFAVLQGRHWADRSLCGVVVCCFPRVIQ